MLAQSFLVSSLYRSRETNLAISPSAESLIHENDAWVEMAVRCTDTPPTVLDIIAVHRAIRDKNELGAWDLERGARA